MTSSDVWGEDTARQYDDDAADKFAPEVLGPTVDFLARLAGSGRALELAIGTGRVGISLAERGTPVTGVEFSLVYLVWNSISNLRTQQEQVECFRNAARHLVPGGRFVIELWVPALRRLPPNQLAVPMSVDEGRLVLDTYDIVTQEVTSHHVWREGEGAARYESGNFRYIWPAECDLMAELAGMTLEQRLADWDGSPFTSESESHVSVWRKP